MRQQLMEEEAIILIKSMYGYIMKWRGKEKIYNWIIVSKNQYLEEVFHGIILIINFVDLLKINFIEYQGEIYIES